jgi:hypothetical protein
MLILKTLTIHNLKEKSAQDVKGHGSGNVFKNQLTVK